jgi:regulatory protein
MDHLRAKGFSAEAVDEAVGRLETYGYVDDVEFARLWVRERSAVKRAGRRYIEQELLSRGIGRETVSLALEDYPEETEQENARLEFERLLKRYERAEPCQRKRKIGEGLMRGGTDGTSSARCCLAIGRRGR